MPLLEIVDLTMRFGGLTAVKGLDCRVGGGDVFSIIGPNGAGKTTVFNAITGIYEPTAGSIRFDGHELKRPFTWRIAAACAVIGILTGLATLLAVSDVDGLWRTTINNNMADPAVPFTYAKAWHDLQSYLRGDLSLRRERNGRWAVVTPWAKSALPLERAATREEAEQRLVAVQELIDLAVAGATPIQHDDKWAVLGRDQSQALQSPLFDSADAARARLTTLAEVGRQQTAMPRTAIIAAIVGLALGSAGAWAVWHRARRTPDVVALGGIARTFQNIRLFQNMTVIDNVLVGMDRKLRAGLLRMIFHTPAMRARDLTARQQVTELLKFVGLEEQGSLLAKQLAYGDERRLEIARALATQPRLLLLDEPAAGMNPSETGELMELIRRIRGKAVTVLLIEHHMNVVMGISDRIAVLDHGVKIAEGGTPGEVRADPKVIEAYLGKDTAC